MQRPRRTIHYTEVKIPPEDHPYHPEWITWLREMPRLLAEGFEGKYVIVQEDTILGPYETLRAAITEGERRYGTHTRYLIRQIFENEPVIFTPYPVRLHA